MHTWGKPEGPVSIRLSFVLSVTAVIIPMIGLLLAVRPPDAIASSRPAIVHASSAEAFQGKINQLYNVQEHRPSEIKLTSDEVTAGLSQSNTNPVASDPVVSFEGDRVKARFMAQVAGEHVYVTIGGRLGLKDGYITFEPTQFAVGHLTIPVALVNKPLQNKIQEAREQLKLPSYISDLRVKDGELVISLK
jgi:hypothetical protein